MPFPNLESSAFLRHFEWFSNKPLLSLLLIIFSPELHVLVLFFLVFSLLPSLLSSFPWFFYSLSHFLHSCSLLCSSVVTMSCICSLFFLSSLLISYPCLTWPCSPPTLLSFIPFLSFFLFFFFHLESVCVFLSLALSLPPPLLHFLHCFFSAFSCFVTCLFTSTHQEC